LVSAKEWIILGILNRKCEPGTVSSKEWNIIGTIMEKVSEATPTPKDHFPRR
jgi:hypothetical protein